MRCHIGKYIKFIQGVPKNALSELCCSSQSSSLHTYLGWMNLNIYSQDKNGGWRIGRTVEQHSSESAFFLGHPVDCLVLTWIEKGALLRSLPHTISQTQVCELIQAEKTKVFRAGMMRNKLWGQIIVRVIMSKEMTGVTMESNVICITRTWSLYSYCHNND